MKGITYHIIKHIKTKIPGRGNPTKHEAKQLVLITGETLELKQDCSEYFFFVSRSIELQIFFTVVQTCRENVLVKEIL